MKSTNYYTNETLTQLIKANSEKRDWAESLLRMVRTAKSSRGENRNRELARLEAEIVEELTKYSEDTQFYNQILAVNHNFLAQLQQRHPDLTENELLLSCFFLMEVPAESIASLKGISQASLNVARSRLKNKLGIEEGQNLEEYLQKMHNA